MVDSIEIIHDDLAGGTYRFLADFFRLAGAHVRNCILGNEKAGGKYDCVVIVRDRIEENDLNALKERYRNACVVSELLDDVTQAGRKEFLSGVLAYIRGLYRQGNQTAIDIEYEALKKIADVYVDEDIMRCRSAYTYFFKYPDIVKDAQIHFSDAFVKIYDILEKEEKKSKYAIYTMIHLTKCINETCKFRGERLVFDTEQCLKKADEALAVDPKFYNVYILKAFLAEGDDWQADKAEAFYRKGLEKEEDAPYMSYPNYRLGRYYERVRHDQKNAGLYYEKAQKLNALEYRSVYKKALAKRAEKKYYEAIESCKEICNILQRKFNGGYLEPRECEYLFKAHHEMARLYELVGDERNHAIQIRERNDLCELIRTPNRIYRQTFGDYAKEYAELTADRLLGCVNISV